MSEVKQKLTDIGKDFSCAGIYKITNPDGMCYIGKSKNIYKRVNLHKNINNCAKSIKDSFIKFGLENHTIEIIAKAESDKELSKLECEYIKFFKSHDPNFGLNTRIPIYDYTLDKLVVLSDNTEKISRLVVFDKNLWQSGVVACKKTRQSFTAYMNEALEEKLKREDKILSKHN